MIITRYLPRECYSHKPMERVEGAVIHYVSARWQFPHDKFNLEMVWWQTRDLNVMPKDRYTRLLPADTHPKVYDASYHSMVGRGGETWETVHPYYQAHHAGVSSFNGRADCNAFMLGVALVGDAVSDFTKEQYDACAVLMAGYVRRYDFPPENVVGHSDVAPGRKQDPGEHWDWQRYRRLLAAQLHIK